ncbi:rhodanese-like domain-containing protein [Facklamia sp. P12950]|uniref:rhodanese-like domain-containing protein n=2 Tax=unclassified Facklamia TaxID=2622293 RepID=UPI003D1639B4
MSNRKEDTMFPTISIEELYQKSQEKSLNIIDVRGEAEFQEGHIPGSKNIPLNQLPNEYTSLNQDKEYYLVCHSGGRSKRASQFLSKMDYQVTNVTPGAPSWPGELTTD